MKKVILIILLCKINYIYTQSIPINLASNKNFKKAKVYFKDGTSKFGYADYNAIANNKVKFKESYYDKKKTYDSRKVKQLDFVLDSTSYFYKKVGNSRKFVLLKLIKKGEKVSLYTSLNKQSSQPNSLGGLNGISITIYEKKATFYETYFFAKNKDDKAFYFNGDTHGQRFKKTIQRYFSDCEALVNKIKNHQFEKEAILKVIEFYNNSCKEKQSTNK